MNYNLNPVITNLIIGVGVILLVIAALFALSLSAIWVITASIIIVIYTAISYPFIIMKKLYKRIYS